MWQFKMRINGKCNMGLNENTLLRNKEIQKVA
jgi:hypothetical protein